MNQYTPLAFLHANKVTDGKPRVVKIVAGTIAGYDYDATAGCNVVYTIGGIFPVKNSIDEIDQMMNGLNSPLGQGDR